ncbi:DUF1207 domain-containing protein [Ignavibacteria bacterium]|nr:DUF1207 domain-containing protein [Bacteroidota bacterium]MCZ2132419.1 DUF1207 domain-containing protein [Bacteroidota bacterium]
MRLAPIFYIFFLFVPFIPNVAYCYGDILFKPLTANPYEGRVGAMTQFGKEKLRLDIGNTSDLYRFSPAESLQCSAGADFFTYTRLRSEGNFKFPVETSDYYFGVNSSALAPIGNDWTGATRFRVAHISSHLVDGLADSAGHFTEKQPFVYSREFFDLTFAALKNGARLYCGISYVYSRQPRSAEPFIPQAGADLHCPLSGLFEFQGGCDAKLIGIDGAYVPMYSAQAGIALKTSPDRGISLNLYYFGGRNIHGMFFRERDEYLALGFQTQF